MEYIAKDFVSCVPTGDIKLLGITKPISELFFEKRVLSDFAKNVIYKEAEDAFRTQIDDARYIGLWQGEFWGKLVLSAADVYRYTQDAELLEFLKRGAKTLLSLSREDGYLNTYRNSMNVFEGDADVALKTCGKPYTWNWNIWCRKYTLWGILSVYELTGDSDILAGAERLCDQMIDELSANGVELRRTGVFNGLPSCSILKPMMILYGHTGNRKYYDYCKKEIIDNFKRADGRIPNLISNAISGKPICEWYPEPEKWAKAYEMMSCYEGIIEFYRYSGDAECLEAVKSFYDILMKTEYNAIFSVGFNDMFCGASDNINAISEPCDIIHFMRLCYELYLVTGEKRYMDSIELAYYNAFLAGVFNNGEFGSRGVRSIGRHMWGNQCKMQYQHCCVNNMPRGFVRFAECAVMRSEDCIYINMFEKLTAKINTPSGTCEIEVSDGYFVGGRFTVNVKYSGEPIRLRIRIPAWCTDYEISERGYIAEGYYEIMPECSELSFTVDFKSEPKLVTFDKEIQVLRDKSHWKFDRWLSDYAPGAPTPDLFVNENRITVTYGPLLLAKSKRLGNTEDDIFANEPVSPSSRCTLMPIEHGACVNYAFSIEFENGGKTYRTKVCDFASAANEMLSDPRFFSIYF